MKKFRFILSVMFLVVVVATLVKCGIKASPTAITIRGYVQ